jgi:hypothetical protein
MEELISFENLVEQAKQRGVDFGKGDPYNRLRYYTKIGWLPHMVRKKDDGGETKGHYEASALERLVLIEQLKSQNLSNEEISRRLQVKTKLQAVVTVLLSKETRNQIIAYSTLALLLLIFGSELGIIKLGKSKTEVTQFGLAGDATAPRQVIDSGTAFVPKGQKKLFVQTPLIKTSYKVYVSFTQSYSPASQYWVSTIKDYDGFMVELDTPVFSNSEFNWWVTN